MRCIFFSLIFLTFIFADSLQDAIDNALPGSKIELNSGEYKGNIVITKPMIIDGKNKTAHIVGDGNGTVITIKSSNVQLRNLTIRGSGTNHENLNSAVAIIGASNIVIENNDIFDSLFGIDFQEVHKSKILNNFIMSKEHTLGLRGDAIRLWYSYDNIIKQNMVNKSRDIVLWYASGNVIEENIVQNGRYSLHFMYAGKNIVKNNIFKNNSVGIFFMYSSGTIATNNTVQNSVGTFGVGIGLKDSSDFTISNNTIIYNARGIYLDQSPYQPNSINRFSDNKILYNSNAIYLQGVREKSIFTGNTIKGNMEAILNDLAESSNEKIEFHGNFWDTYEGFDIDADGIGDIPYKHYVYADKLWIDNPDIKFFYGSVVIDLLNFLAKLAPFSEPTLLATDNYPLINEDE